MSVAILLYFEMLQNHNIFIQENEQNLMSHATVKRTINL